MPSGSRSLFDGIDVCGGRSRGNARSAAAHANVRERKRPAWLLILEFLRFHGPHTCEEISQRLTMRYTTVSARLSEMKEAKWLTIAGVRPTSAGEDADLVTPTEKAPGPGVGEWWRFSPRSAIAALTGG